MIIINDSKLDLSKDYNYLDKPCIGIVLKTAEELKISNQLGLYIPKLMPSIDPNNGKATESNISISYSKIKNNGNKNIGSKSIKYRNYFKVNALYNTNLTIPEYNKGEKVLVNCIDQDIKTLYFITDSFVNPGKRSKGDIYRIGAISTDPKDRGKDVEVSKANTYYMEFDTKEKKIVIQNSKVNGEKGQYTILLDAKNGTLSLTDGERTLNLNADEDRVTLQNKADSIITMEGENITIQCKNLNIEAEESISMKTKKYSLETNTFEEKSKDATIEHEQYEFKSSSGKEEIDSFEQKSNLYKVEVNYADFQSQILGVKGMVGAAGLAIGPTPPSPSMPQVPKGSSESEAGNSTIKTGTMKINQNGGALPLVKSVELMQTLITMCIEIDKALGSGQVPLPPTASAQVMPKLNQIAAQTVSGS